jgi:tetratricopeptide (TPR) repeat protein
MHWIITCPHGHQRPVAEDKARSGGDLRCPACNGVERPQIPEYEILEELSRGGNRVVYKARQTSLNRLVALEVLRAGPQASPEDLVRLHVGAEVAANLEHPNIVCLCEVGEQNGWAYLVWEYADGGSLAQKLDGTPLPPLDAAQVVEMLARAVQAAHQQGIVHPDLKPANILFASAERDSADPCGPPTDLRAALAGSILKITGFGRTRQGAGESETTAASPTDAGAIAGSASYLAPEQAADDKSPTPSGNVYSLGAILYELLTGRPPFKAPTPEETLEQVRTQEPVPPGRLQPGVPGALETICLKCLEKDPRRRYGSAEELADDLNGFLQGERIQARAAGPVVRLRRYAGRWPVLAVLAGAGGLALAVLLAVVVWHNIQLREELDSARQSEAVARKARQDNFRIACTLANQLLTRLEDKRLAAVPQVRALHQSLLDDARKFYNDLLEVRKIPDPVERFDTAVANGQAGKIEAGLRNYRAAAQRYRQARLLLETLLDEEPNNFDYRSHLAATYNATGYIASSLGLPPREIRIWFQKGLTLREQLHRTHPDNVAVQNDLAQSHYNLGFLLLTTQQPDQAEPHLDQAIALLKELVRAEPDVSAYQAALAKGYNDLALLYRYTNHKAKAKDYKAKANSLYREARTILEPLVKGRPGEVQTASEVALLYVNWANLLNEEGRTTAALDQLAAGLALLDRVPRRERDSSQVRATAFNLHGARAVIYQKAHRFAESARDWDRVVELTEGPQRDANRLTRALVLAHAGDHARSAARPGPGGQGHGAGPGLVQFSVRLRRGGGRGPCR